MVLGHQSDLLHQDAERPHNNDRAAEAVVSYFLRVCLDAGDLHFGCHVRQKLQLAVGRGNAYLNVVVDFLKRHVHPRDYF